MNLAEQMEKDFAAGNMLFGKMQGMSELKITLVSILFLNEEPVSIEELSKKTGYSLSAISTAMKTLEILRKVNKVKKPGNKKVYYEANRDVIGTMKQMFQHFKQVQEVQLKETLPKIVEKYGKYKDKEVVGKMKMLKVYESEFKIMGKIIDEMLIKMETL